MKKSDNLKFGCDISAGLFNILSQNIYKMIIISNKMRSASISFIYSAGLPFAIIETS